LSTEPIPHGLLEWTYDAVARLCSAGVAESDRHDFKFDLRGLSDPSKLCCAFANTFGGFIVFGVKDETRQRFAPVGLDPDKELFGEFRAKIKADPEIGISQPSLITIPESSKLIYVFEIPASSRRPHLPTPPDKRTFWKRQGSACVQMTLEEIRYQMNTYEEKREKLALLLIDMRLKLRSLEGQAALGDGNYNGDLFTFDVIDRVVAESYALLKDDLNTIGVLQTFRSNLQLVNAEKQKMIHMLALSYDRGCKDKTVNEVRDLAARQLPQVTLITEQVERSFKEKFGIDSPYAPKR
jgi:hypothetical protein